MKLPSILLLLVAAFCVYGFVASFEPSPGAIYFRLGYPILAVACVVTAIGLSRRP